jgi:hypothetical protein
MIRSWLLVLAFTSTALSAVTPPGAQPTPGAADERSTATCVESIPEGKEPPKFTESFPTHGKSGHRAVLLVEVEHGPGERVLPSALHVDEQSPTFRALSAAGFRFPSSSGPSRPRLRRAPGPESARTQFSLPLVLLPSEAGRNELTLPPLPIAVARASGEILTLCTREHSITVEEPTANEPNPTPRANPSPGRQLELFASLRTAVYGGALGLALALVLGLLFRAWRKRPKKEPPPPPPRPPWEVALEALSDIRRSGWVEAGRFDEHFDRVSHVLRRYLGDRYGFDALECTTHEVLGALASRQVGPDESTIVERFLNESDLVKFANLTPTEAQCHWLWAAAEDVVRRTTASAVPGASATSSEEPQHGA